jgi:hypothetical protein
MEIGLPSSDIPDARTYIARHRRVLRNHRNALFWLTLAGLTVLGVITVATLHQQSIWRSYHNRAMAAVDQALRGNKKAVLPPSIGLGVPIESAYQDLFRFARASGDIAKERNSKAKDCLTKLEQITSQIPSDSPSQLRSHYAELEQVYAKAKSIHPIYASDDMCLYGSLKSLKGLWEGSRRHNNLNFEIDRELLKTPPECSTYAGKIDDRIAEMTTDYVRSAIFSGGHIRTRLLELGTRKDWVRSMPLDKKNLSTARYEVSEAAEEVMIHLENELDLDESMLDHFNKYRKEFNPPRGQPGPEITLL